MAGKWLGCAWVIAALLLLVGLAAVPAGSSLANNLGWVGVVILWPGPMVGALVYLVIRGLRHRYIHARLDPCPWCQTSTEYHALPREMREARDRLRKRLRHSETHVD